MHTYGLIDSRNNNLWTELNKVHKIIILFDERTDYLVFSQNNETTIYVPQNNKDPASFTHELLHVYLRTKKVFVTGGLKGLLGGYPNLSKIFPDRLIEHVGNCLDHVKMFPEFLRLGYEGKQFLSDNSVHKLTKSELENIKTSFVIDGGPRKIYNSSAVELYIGKFFSVKCSLGDSLDYKAELTELKYIDSSLYQVLDNFLIAWDNYDFNSTDPLAGSYNTYILEFITELDNWISGKALNIL